MRNLAKKAGVVLAASMLGLTVAGVSAQAFPTKPIRIVLPASPGSGIDTFSRFVARELSTRVGQGVVVENMPGAGGNIASMNVARAAPDGHTLLMQITSFVIAPNFYKSVSYDPVKDYQPVILAARGGHGMLVVHPKLESVKTVKDLIALSKAQPGRLNYASPGFGTPQHLQMEIFKRISGADFTHVPYKTPADVAAIVAGDVTAIFLAASVAITHWKNGKLKILASTGRDRWIDTPEIPTMIESGFPDFTFDVWYGFLAPAGTPADIVGKLNGEFAQVMSAPTTKQALQKQALTATTSTPEEFAAVIRNDLAYWAKTIKEIGIKAE